MTDATYALDCQLIRSGFMPLSASTGAKSPVASRVELGTVLSNLVYYGYVPSAEAMGRLLGLSSASLARGWKHLHELLSDISGTNRDMDRHVVYKNFPREVLEKSRAEYWVAQICMYHGLPSSFFAEEEATRPAMAEIAKFKVLDVAPENAYDLLFERLRLSGASWQPEQEGAAVEYLALNSKLKVDLASFSHRGNGVILAVELAKAGRIADVTTTSATDVLRLAAGMSDGDPTLKIAPRFAKFSRPVRRALVEMLAGCADLEGDFARRREIWKRLLSRLHPGDFKIDRVNRAYEDLFAGSKTRLSARIENGFKLSDINTLEILAGEPGTYARRLHHAYAVFGRAAFERFVPLIDKLSTQQILKLAAYFETIGSRQTLLVRPNGNWAKAQILSNTKAAIVEADRMYLLGALREAVSARVDIAIPQGVALDFALADVKLATTGQELAAYGRGTEFDIPEGTTFLRSASFWQHPTDHGNTWFDNGWNFFTEGWQPFGSCCWTEEKLRSGRDILAAFSGDPTNSSDLKGRGCQMIDLYLDKLRDHGVRYAVWSVLCYSGVPFSKAEDVLATLQWGENAETGRLYEPSRAQMAFPLKGDALTKFVAYIDVVRGKLCFMDVDISASVYSANSNLTRLHHLMPAFEDYTRSLPSVADLFVGARDGSLPVLRSDADVAIDGPAYVVERRRDTNRIEPLDIEAILGAKAA